MKIWFLTLRRALRSAVRLMTTLRKTGALHTSVNLAWRWRYPGNAGTVSITLGVQLNTKFVPSEDKLPEVTEKVVVLVQFLTAISPL